MNAPTGEALTQFLESGSFYREAPEKIHVWWGENSSNSGAGELVVGRQEFWGTDLENQKYAEHQVLTQSEFRHFLEPALVSNHWKISDFVAPQKTEIEKSFQAIQGRIQREEIDKAVVIGSAQSLRPLLPADRAAFSLNVIEAPSTLHAFGSWNQNGGVLGATPEILFSRNEDEVHTMALAGSCPKDDISDRVPLLKDPKEMREHMMVVQDISERLKPLGWLTSEATEVVELPTILHLRTQIRLKGNRKSDAELVRTLHPTAAMAQFPRNYGLAWMKELPYQLQRGFHGGVLVFPLSESRSIALVAIRSLLWNIKTTWVTAGCGVVKESVVDREWREMVAKIDSIYKILGVS